MALTLSSSSLSFSTIKIGGTVEATAAAVSQATITSTTTSTTTTTTTVATVTGYGRSGIVGVSDGKECEMDGNLKIPSLSSINLSDSIMRTTVSPLATTIAATTEATTVAVAVTANNNNNDNDNNNSNNNNIQLDSVAQLTSADDILLDELSSRFRGVLPVQPSPLLLPSDHISSSLKSTRLNGHLIYCFVIGGECRLCFPQIISVVLRGVAINDINELFVDLNIHISVASQQQLDTLKLAGVMPMTADSCGLVTKSDAERLVAKLLPQCNGYRLTTDIGSYDTDAVPVVHDCFDGCTGTLIPMLDTDEQIECTQCKLLFTGEKFVSHSHSIQQIRRICHWGFDSSNWRHYLHLPESYEDDLKALKKLELYKYPPVRLGKRPASHAFTAVENGNCSKLANLSTTTSTKSVEVRVAEDEVEAEAGIGIRVDPTVSTSVQSLNDINEHILKLYSAAQATAVAATALTAATLKAPLTTVTQDSSFLPLQVPVVGASGCCTGQSSGTPLTSPQLQSLLALQFITSQLPLSELCKLPILTNPSSNVTSDIRWKPVYETQSSALSSVPVVDSKSVTNMRQHIVASDEDFSSKGTPISSTINSDILTCMISKTGTSLERLLDQTLKEPVLSVAKLLVTEFRREKELLLNQNGQLRRENALLRSALASSTVLVGLKGLTAANVPIS
ncbi:unnamed protein product [Cercopithifilaria johnstoni]|uniref:c-SKI SMAD4-binding domain-containing protein n=1 Tax=Cercopithifilaria johnstoni TaxID=2874296 RepID=A0A8J2Q378_9BILA|nr:unnamed protein product [Cercopithifilaria johnstoni]